MDMKILSAVFVSVAALATGINTGSLEASDVRNADLTDPTESSLQDFLPNSFDFLKNFVEKPEPEKSVRVDAEIDSKDPLKMREADLRVLDMENYTSRSLSIESDEEIVFRDFSGEFRPVNGSTFSGSASGFMSSGVNVSERLNIDFSTTKPSKMLDTEKTSVKLSGTFRIESNSTSTTVENSSLKINSFSGNIEVFPEESRIVLDGKVDRLSAGDLTIEAD